MRRYLRIFSLYFQHGFQYRARNFMWLIISFINPLVLLLFWQGILGTKQSIGGWSLTLINSYYIFIIVASALLMQHVEFQVAYYDIKRGELVRELLKPFSYTKMRFIAESPWRILQGIYAIAMVALLIYLLKKPVVIFPHADQLIYIFLIALNAYILSFFFKMALSLTAFWLTSVDGIFETNDVATIMLSGLVLPLELLPAWLHTLAIYTPYPYILHYPVGAAIGLYTTASLQLVILIQLVWIGGLALLYRFMWSRGLKQFTGVGQ